MRPELEDEAWWFSEVSQKLRPDQPPRGESSSDGLFFDDQYRGGSAANTLKGRGVGVVLDAANQSAREDTRYGVVRQGQFVNLPTDSEGGEDLAPHLLQRATGGTREASGAVDGGPHESQGKC
ncbi:hypothetical protein AK812_SmicGene45138 [Symbiodinium microadriaticum]|uniref:Uncharacterized protein n=1 Tax=Symbiodinium microadriaticum TaxID=2951 RepID=A0A1Q9BWP1_SYMMI|nr:hypothetical protein AK812_SmicGene45138 [Symbiodinium microadriaticum]